jgi:hypothetical protein
MPPIGAEVKLWAYCRGCGSNLGYWHFVWEGEARKFTSHICSGHTQDVVVQMEWLEIGEPLEDAEDGPAVSAAP